MGKCSLCKSDLEDCLHLFILCPLLLDIWKKLSSLLGTQVDGDMSSTAAWIVHGKDNQKHSGLFLFTFFGAYGALRMSSSLKRFLLMPSCHLFTLLHIFRKSSPSALRNPPGQSHWSICPTLSQFSSSMRLEGVVVVESPSTLTLKYPIASGGLADLGTIVGSKC